MAYMKHNLLKEIEIGSKNALVKKRIITHYIYNGSSTITDLSKEMDLSVPTVTKFIDEMCEDSRELMKEKARYAIKLFQNRG